MKFVWPPLINALDERSKKIADGLSAAEKGKAELEAAPAYDMEQLASAQYAWGEQVDAYFGGLTPA